ncbi:MAG: DUF72 domain-containing protein [Planctomycetota bacterium]
MVAGRIRWGTSSWSEKSWVGPFYPPGTPPGDFLAFYATQFDTVEADVTYYRIPDARTVATWARRLPAGFALAAKFPRSIVHGGEDARPDPERALCLDRVQGDVELFLERMGALGERCGPLVLQLPYYNRQVFASRAPFFARLAELLAFLPARFRYGVELRNEKWIDAELLDLLRSHRAALVWSDLAYLAHPADLARRLDLVTADFAYGRLIGDRQKVEALTTSFDRVVLDQTPRLERWAELLGAVRERVPEIYVYANNHYAGHGPATIRQLRAMVP